MNQNSNGPQQPQYLPQAAPQYPQQPGPQYAQPQQPQAAPQYPQQPYPPQQPPQAPPAYGPASYGQPPQAAPQYPQQPQYGGAPPQYPPQVPQGAPLMGMPPAPGVTNMFAGLRDAKTTTKGAYLRPGRYEVRVTGVVYIPVFAGGNAFIVNFVIERSNYEESLATAIRALGGAPYNLRDLDKTMPNKVGEAAGWYVGLKPNPKDIQQGWGNIKRFAAEICDEDPESPGFHSQVEMFVSAIVQTGALNGALLPVDVVNVKKKDGGDFSAHNWAKMIQPPGSVGPSTGAPPQYAQQ
jgi:hypothetical protein